MSVPTVTFGRRPPRVCLYTVSPPQHSIPASAPFALSLRIILLIPGRSSYVSVRVTTSVFNAYVVQAGLSHHTLGNIFPPPVQEGRIWLAHRLRVYALSPIVVGHLSEHASVRGRPFYFLFFVPFVIFYLLFSLPPRGRNSNPRSHSRLFSPSPLPYTPRICIARRLRPFVPLSTRIKWRLFASRWHKAESTMISYRAAFERARCARD